MKILITGGGGLVGQAIAKKHLSMGDDVYIYDLQVNEYNDYSNLVGTDLTTKIRSAVSESFSDGLATIIDRYNFDVISNQAALVGVGQSQYKIVDYNYYNVLGTAKLLQAIADTKKFPMLFLHAGSMGPYGEGAWIGGTDEYHKMYPKSIYGVTKLAQEEMVRVFSQTYGVEAISLRYFSVYSTDQTPLNPYTGVLSIIANQCLNSDHIELYGDGTQARDLIHVNDVADAHYITTRTFVNNLPANFIALNIGTGKSTPLAKIALSMKYKLAPEKKIVFNGKYRKGDVYKIYANTQLTDFMLEWRAKIKLEDGIEQYCCYIKRNRDKFTIGKNTLAIENEQVKTKGLIQ